MWHSISEQIGQQLGFDFVVDNARQVGGGDTNQTFKISDGHQRFFVKLNSKFKLENFECEAQGLEHLSQAQAFRVPKVICTGTVAQNSFLVLEYISLNEGSSDTWRVFGQKLAAMHQYEPQKMYGWQDDNFVGATYQPNQWHKKWSHFYSEQRIGYLLQLLKEKKRVSVDIDKAVETIKVLLTGHNPTASMLHGDLWHGNAGFHNDEPVIFDPAFYYGDREVEIAMTELFGKFPAGFYKGYQEESPLDEGYQYRKSIYQLYPILNHALLFGGQYIETAKSILLNLDN